MSFGIYIHIPYCIQRCTYCDFATYEQTKLLPPDDYTDLLLKEISFKKDWFKSFTQNSLTSLFFGGGTPSLFSIKNIVLLLDSLSSNGFTLGPETEVTMEINPGTVDEEKLNAYLKLGINRFSVGAQSFNQEHLKRVHREHTVQQTIDFLKLLKKYNLNFNFDLLFGLPYQTKEELSYDIEQAVELGSTHISPYYLTVPEGHPLSKNRPLEDDQVFMFELIERTLENCGFNRYEISNYAKPGFESKHNYLYWTDKSYWGLGLSSHSYINHYQNNPWGIRFWNPNNIKIFTQEVSDFHQMTDPSYSILPGPEKLDSKYYEILNQNQSLTDFCHTSLRISRGLILSELEQKFDSKNVSEALKRISSLIERKLLEPTKEGFTLTRQGKMISNFVFERLTF